MQDDYVAAGYWEDGYVISIRPLPGGGGHIFHPVWPLALQPDPWQGVNRRQRDEDAFFVATLL